MARTTTNYGFNISEGTDLVNPLTDIFPNFEDIDTDLKAVSNSAVGKATEITTGTVHAITRSDSDRDVFVFIATSNWTAGDTITVDGTQVSILTPDGQALATGAYIIGSAVLCVLNGTLITAIVNAAKAKDSDKLDGEDSTYYATASDLSATDGVVSGLSTKVGSAVLTTTAPDCCGAINELNDKLTWKLAGQNTGATTIQIPAGATEICAKLHVNATVSYSQYVPVAMITNTHEYYTHGSYVAANNNRHAYFNVSTSGVYANAIENGVNVTSTCLFELWYR